MNIQSILEGDGFQVKQKSRSGEWCSPCPFCGGEDRFCFWPATDNYWCRQCQRKGDAIELLRDLKGMTFPEAVEAVGGKPLDSPKPHHPPRAPAPSPQKPKAEKPQKKIIETYDYTDETGATLLYQVCRFDPKDFRQRRPDGSGGWTWNMDGQRLVMFHLSEVHKADKIFVVEGEKDCKTIESIGFVATCNPMGAGKIKGQHETHKILAPLYEKEIYILPDNDKPGQDHAQEIASILYGKAAQIKIITLPGLPDKGDVSDFVAARGDKAKSDLIEQIYATDQWHPPSNFTSAEILLSTQFESRPPIIAHGIMPHNSHIIISGESGVGKSLLRLHLALHLITGRPWLGFEIPRPRKVAIFQFENSEAMEQTRLRRMAHGLQINSLPRGMLTYVGRSNRVNISLKRDRDRLRDLVAEAKSEVIIYDCLSNLHTAKENDNVAMRDILDTLTEINTDLQTSCIVIHHFGKPGPDSNGDDVRYRTRGASSIMDWAVTAMAYTVKSHESKTLRQLQFLKVRDGAVPKPMLLERDENFCLEVTDDGTLCSPAMVRDLLEDLGGRVESQGELIRAIMQKASCSPRSAKSFIYRAIEFRMIRELPGQTPQSKVYEVA